MIQSDSEALTILDDTGLGPLQREEAVHYIENHPSLEGIRRLVDALDDDDFGVRWAAAVALSQQGKAVLPVLLQALTERADDPWLREGAYHVLHYNEDPDIRMWSRNLMRALRGPGADVATLEAAYQLLHRLG